eukprot:1159014-Pelagomonas_calceolata.AAC.14
MLVPSALDLPRVPNQGLSEMLLCGVRSAWAAMFCCSKMAVQAHRRVRWRGHMLGCVLAPMWHNAFNEGP